MYWAISMRKMPAESWYEPHKTLTQTLFEELKARKPEQDEGVPYEKNGYRYQWRFKAGDQYRVGCAKAPWITATFGRLY